MSYPLEARCHGGALPKDGTIFKSAGSSGRPTGLDPIARRRATIRRVRSARPELHVWHEQKALQDSQLLGIWHMAYGNRFHEGYEERWPVNQHRH